jgi:hypothetical protein
MRILVLALVLCLPLLGGEPADDLAALKWLAGNWQADKWGGTFHAHYSTPDGGKIVSYSKLVAGGALKFYEFELFEVVDGKVTYTPHPAGRRSPHSFPLVESGAQRAVFANDEHDWPKRIVFERPAERKLVITLSGGEKKEVFSFDRSP